MKKIKLFFIFEHNWLDDNYFDNEGDDESMIAYMMMTLMDFCLDVIGLF